MMAADGDALACDIAETYGIYDIRALPATRLAVLAVGLRDDSRIKMKLAGMRVPMDNLMSAAIIDRLSWIVWAQSKDGQNGTNKPAQLVEKLTGREEKKDKHIIAYEKSDDYEAARKRILEKAGH